MTGKGRCDIGWQDDSGNITCTLDVSYTYSTGRPAKTYGDPDDCYPADPGEIEWTLETVNDIVVNGSELTAGTLRDSFRECMSTFITRLEKGIGDTGRKFREHVEEAIWEDIAQTAVDRRS